MQQSLITIGMLAGGVGLFLLAVHMITDGLKRAVGYALRDLLGKWTRSPVRGIVTGLSITALVQSSSAVTVATIGFVNAGLINLYQALGVVYGSNIGTTVTGWLVVMIGFEIKVETFAMPLIGLGMLLRITGGDSRRAHIGMALAGFGLFFTGIDVLKEAFEGLASNIDLGEFAVVGTAGILLHLAIGFLMTVLTQSSSAAIAITLTAVSGGLLGLHAAAAMVIGANVGTTSTAALAVIGATPNAKRVAAAHILFNVGTGVVALMILPLLFRVVEAAGALLEVENMPTVAVALFHTIFNILGVLLMLPLSNRLARFLSKRFVTHEEIEGRPKYLDKTVAVSPVLALNALSLELSRIATVTRRMALEALSTESAPGKRIVNDHLVAKNLSNAVAEFIAHLEKDILSDEVAAQLAKVLRAEQHLLTCANQAMAIARVQSELGEVTDIKLMDEIAHYHAEAVRLMKMANHEEEGFSFTDCDTQMQQVRDSYDSLKGSLLQAGAELRIPIPLMIDILEQNSRIRRMPRHMLRAMHYLGELSMTADVTLPEPTSEIDLDEEETKQGTVTEHQ